MEETAEGLASERPYRSRTQPPCQRCRSRKQRCITRPNGVCINCQIAGTSCIISSPVEGPARARSRTTTSNKGERQIKRQRLSEDLDDKRYVSGEPSIPTASTSHTPLAPSPRLASQHNSPTVTIQPTHHATSPLSASANGPWMGSSFSSILSSWDYSTYSSHPVAVSNNDDDHLRPLDADAGDEFEPHYVGGTAERDALVLSAIASIPRLENSDGSEHSASTPASSTFRVRQVSTNPAEPVFFLFERTQPYGDDTDANEILGKFLILVGHENVERLLQNYINIDGLAVPIWSPEHFQGSHRYVPPGVYCSYLCRGLIHDDQLRHLTRPAWKLVLQIIRPEARRARLATIQANLLDLDGRPSLDPTGNSVVLGQTIAAARLLGLHLDCSDWSIPMWEKNLRIRLWWALLQQDKWTALCCGRSSYIHYNDWNVPLPSTPATSHTSLDTFIALCELTLILGRILKDLHVVRPSATMKDSLTVITSFGFELDAWKQRLDMKLSRLGGQTQPGLRSLQLSYLAVALLLARSVLDRELPPNVLRSAQESAFKVTEQVISFTTALTPEDLRGYWTIHTAFHFSTCLVLLIRLTLQSDLNDQSDDAVWQRALHQLHIFVSALSKAKRTYPGFELGDLALARARHLIPLLTQRIPELAVVLEPLTETASLPTPSPSNGETDQPEVDLAQGLDAFFPELAEPDWATLRDFMPYPFMQLNAFTNTSPQWQY